MVSTTTLRPASAARTARAADVVVLPTPPAPQQMMILVSGSAKTESISKNGDVTRRPRGRSAPAAARRWRTGPPHRFPLHQRQPLPVGLRERSIADAAPAVEACGPLRLRIRQ